MRDLAELETRRDELELLINSWEIDESVFEDSYCDMLDECYPEVFGISPSRILRECDPIAYSCGLSDYVDSLELTVENELESEHTELEEINELIEELEKEIK